MGGNSPNFDQIKRALTDLVAELHARKLAIPAGALLCAILAAIFVLPKSPTPPPPATAAPVANTNQQVDTEAVVSLKLVGVTPLDNGVPISHSSDPFGGSGSAKCVRVGSGTPKKFDCRIGDLVIHYVCQVGVTDGICGDSGKAAGASSETGASSSTGGSSTGGSTGSTGETPAKKKTTKKSYIYVVSVTLDGRKYKNQIAGDGIPTDDDALAVYAGPNSKATKAIFILGDGASVTGVAVDEDLGNFELSKGQTVTITDKLAAEHTLTLNSISKVKK